MPMLNPNTLTNEVTLFRQRIRRVMVRKLRIIKFGFDSFQPDHIDDQLYTNTRNQSKNTSIPVLLFNVYRDETIGVFQGDTVIFCHESDTTLL